MFIGSQQRVPTFTAFFAVKVGYFCIYRFL